MNLIICPVRNGLAMTQAALGTFLSQDIGDILVSFIDNGSVDGTTQWIWSQPQEQVISTYHNPPLSVSESWNSVLNHVFVSEPVPLDYALVVNNDVLLRPDTYRLLVEDGGEFVTAVGVNDPKQIQGEPNPSSKRKHPDFSCFVIRKSCWDKVGPFNEEYKGAYLEDCEYHVRMHRRGVRACCIDVPYYHRGSGTLEIAGPKEEERINKLSDENRQRFLEKFGCNPGTAQYGELFKEDNFGSDPLEV
jgi:glycosyltransferase involved in cell wall biosynthesis